MNPRLSVLLDLMRFAAAMTVMVSHLSGLLIPEIPAWLGRHGQEAVSVFFVLSGFVIAYSCDRGDGSWRDYATARASRLYSVVIPCVLTIVAADAIGRSVNHDWYMGQTFVGPGPSPSTLFPTLAFTNELWFDHVVLGTAEPFWSLGFEVSYYVLFGIILFSRGATRAALCFIWMILVGPKILIYLPLWLAGALTWRLLRSGKPIRFKWLAWALLLLLPVAYGSWEARFGETATAQFLWPSTQEALSTAGYHMVIAAMVAIAIVALSVVTHGRAGYPAAAVRPITWLAGGSFTLYLLHQPLIALAAALMPPASSVPLRVAALFAILFIIALVAEVGERRKPLFARGIRRMMGWTAESSDTAPLASAQIQRSVARPLTKFPPAPPAPSAPYR